MTEENKQDEKKKQCVVLNVQNCTFSNGLVAQLVRAPPCHGGGRGFEPHPGRLQLYIVGI